MDNVKSCEATVKLTLIHDGVPVEFELNREEAEKLQAGLDAALNSKKEVKYVPYSVPYYPNPWWKPYITWYGTNTSSQGQQLGIHKSGMTDGLMHSPQSGEIRVICSSLNVQK